MTEITTILVSVLGGILTSSGLWALILRFIDMRTNQAKMILGLGHDKIIYLGKEYIKRGWITADEYENLHDYLYIPYKNMGGNGSAERIMEEVKKLPIKASI